MQVTDVTAATNPPATGRKAEGGGLNSVIHAWTVWTSRLSPRAAPRSP